MFAKCYCDGVRNIDEQFENAMMIGEVDVKRKLERGERRGRRRDL